MRGWEKTFRAAPNSIVQYGVSGFGFENWQMFCSKYNKPAIIRKTNLGE